MLVFYAQSTGRAKEKKEGNNGGKEEMERLGEDVCVCVCGGGVGWGGGGEMS